jgi:hypothetical protein
MSQADSDCISILPPAARPAAKFSPIPAVRLAHANLINSLLIEQPEAIFGCWAHPAEIAGRATHLAKLLTEVTNYISVILADTQDFASRIEVSYLTGLLRDTTSDIAGGVMFAAESPEGI